MASAKLRPDEIIRFKVKTKCDFAQDLDEELMNAELSVSLHPFAYDRHRVQTGRVVCLHQ